MGYGHGHGHGSANGNGLGKIPLWVFTGMLGASVVVASLVLGITVFGNCQDSPKPRGEIQIFEDSDQGEDGKLEWKHMEYKKLIDGNGEIIFEYRDVDKTLVPHQNLGIVTPDGIPIGVCGPDGCVLIPRIQL